MSHKLIDFDIIKLFINGTDEDRTTIKKLYPELDIQSLREELLWSIVQDHMNHPKRTYPVIHRGKEATLIVTHLQNEQN